VADPSDLSNAPGGLEPPFRCEVLRERDAVRVCPIGSLDLATTPELEQQIEELRRAGVRHLIIDLRGLTFMDSTGLRLALKLDAASRQDGFEIGFVPGPPAVQRVFEVTGTTDVVRFVRA
jgi:anti-sigma B factor antagonist